MKDLNQVYDDLILQLDNEGAFCNSSCDKMLVWYGFSTAVSAMVTILENKKEFPTEHLGVSWWQAQMVLITHEANKFHRQE